MALTKTHNRMIAGSAVNVIDYGAVGDGVTDDAAAFQAAINANLGKLIIIPEGTYKIGTTLSMNTTGLGDTSVCQFIGAGMYKTIIDNQTGGPAFYVQSGTSAEFAYNFKLENLSIISTGPDTGTIGVRIEGTRYTTINNVRIDGMDSHGIYGLSTVGDFTDTLHTEIRQCKIEDCGGYGVFAEVDGNAIHYSWNMYECSIGTNTLGGVLWESMVAAEMSYCGIYYNQGFGLRITNGSGVAPTPKQIHIDHCEFDTNDGVQVDLPRSNAILLTAPYLIANTGLSVTYTKGIVIGANSSSIVIQQAAPRWGGGSGLVGIEIASGATDCIARDTSYSGYSVLYGSMYVDNSAGEFVIDDSTNRAEFETGTWTVQVKDASGNTSATTVTGHYTANGNLITASFRNLDDIDTSGMTSGDILFVTLPIACASGASKAFVGQCLITTDSGSASGAPMPYTANGASTAYFARASTGNNVTVGNLTSGTSDIDAFTLTYQR